MLIAALVLIAAAGAPAAGTLVVLNKAEASASLIDLASGKVAATLPTGDGPHEAAVSPDGRLALCANYGRGTAGSTLTVLDVPGAKVVRTIALGEYRRPHGVHWLDGRRALVTCEENQALLVVDVDTGRVAQAVTTGQRVSHMVTAAPDGTRAFVASIGSGTLTAVDLAAGKVTGHVETGAGAEGLAITPDGREVWVTNRAADSVSVVDAATLRVLATLPSKSFPIRVEITPDGRHALVSNARSGDLTVFDVGARRELRRVPMKLEAAPGQGRLFEDFGKSPAPVGIEIAPDGRRAWVANTNADAIAEVDLASWTVTRLLQAGQEPDGMAYSPLAPGASR